MKLSTILCLLVVQTLGQKVDINWQKVVKVSKTVPTLQVVVNPLIERKQHVHDQIFKGLAELNATHVRFVPWLPYPRLGVAELATAAGTSWNFTLIDPMVEDFMRAQNGREVVINFSTMPAWLFKTPKKVAYPDDPDQVFWQYTQGTELVDPTMKQLGDYYERLVSWYVKGGFTDENGKEHKSDHKFKFDYWEVFNEVEAEHQTTPEQYNQRYDAVVTAVRKASPDTKFVGLALAFPDRGLTTFLPHFLNHSNHGKDIPLDAVSYHFYAQSNDKQDINQMAEGFFQQADNFLKTVVAAEKIRTELSPGTKTMINELGTMHESGAIPKEYWNLSGAMYAYLFSKMSDIGKTVVANPGICSVVGVAFRAWRSGAEYDSSNQDINHCTGIDFAGESQLVGYPSQYPSVSMVDWTTGALNPRAIVLKLLIQSFGAGDQLVDTVISGTDAVHASGMTTKSGKKRLLLINKKAQTVAVELKDKPSVSTFIDVSTGDQIQSKKLTTNTVTLGGFAVNVVDF